jgi:omega-3 fatty acid desaturase (delta-15 desaturase)
MSRIGRLSLPWSMFAYPFYLWKRSPGKTGSHYDPKCDLFVTQQEKEQVCVRHVYVQVRARIDVRSNLTVVSL